MKVTAILASQTVAPGRSNASTPTFASRRESTTLAAVLVDDGSVDGTAESVRQGFPAVEVIGGDGELYWAGAMALAERAALAHRPDYLLWLNDDVVLDRDALARLIETCDSRAGRCIAVGALRDPVTGELTYSGVRRRGCTRCACPRSHLATPRRRSTRSTATRS